MVNNQTAEQRYAALVELFSPEAGVRFESGSGFGSQALKVDGRIFAMLVRGNLVLKLPARRVAALVAAGEGVHFDANKGKPMKEWLVVQADSRRSWSELAREALGFVGRR